MSTRKESFVVGMQALSGNPYDGSELKKSKQVKEIFNWAKTAFIGLAKMKAQNIFTLAVYNLTRMTTIFGWRLNKV